MPPRLWQRQPGESPPDFAAFVAYLRLQGRRSHRAVAAQTGRSLGAIRRLSAQFNWRARVAAFQARLADASQDALAHLPNVLTMPLKQSQNQQMNILAASHLLADALFGVLASMLTPLKPTGFRNP
jgi:hypothetical protein